MAAEKRTKRNLAAVLLCLLLCAGVWVMQSGFYRKFIPEKKDTLTIGVFSDSYWEVQNG